jgi:two-component system, LytTR family, sensor kinase
MPTGTALRNTAIHALAWLGFILYEVSIVLYTAGPLMATWWEYAGYYAMNMLLFYVNAHVVLAYAFRRKKALYLILFFIPLELGLYILFEYGLEHFFNLLRAEPANVQLNQRFLVGYIWRGTYFIGLSTTYWFVRRTFQHTRKINLLELQQLEAQKEMALLEKDLVTSQNAYLQAQINPHFLFNTLNLLYNHVRQQAPKAAEIVILLSEVMRYTVSGVQEDGKAELSKEIEHLQRYIALNQLRYKNPLHLHLQVNDCFQKAHRLPPLVLLTFVENMFKHGDMTDPTHPGCVSVRREADLLIFHTRNKKRFFSSHHSFGIGMQNVYTRLARLYEKQDYMLDIQEDDLYYSLHFKIKLL